MLPSSKGNAVDKSSLKRICSVKRQYAPQLQRICSGYILFKEDMLSQEGICFPEQRICNGHILFEEEMLSQERICFPAAKDIQWTYTL
jgi:hypothetical protein